MSKGKNSVRNLRYGPRTRLVRGMLAKFLFHKCFRNLQNHPPFQFVCLSYDVTPSLRYCEVNWKSLLSVMA